MRTGRLSGARRIVAALGLMAFCGFVVLWSVVRAHAAWSEARAWTVAGDMLASDRADAEDVDHARALLAPALARFPRHPVQLELDGQLLETRASLPGSVGRERTEALEEAALRYRQSLVTRPLWPHAWSLLLGVKSQLGQIDGEFRLALERTTTTGPEERRPQLQVIEAGLRHWSRLAGGERDLVRDTAQAALVVQPREVFELAQRYERPDLVCGAASHHAAIGRWCERQ